MCRSVGQAEYFHMMNMQYAKSIRAMLSKLKVTDHAYAVGVSKNLLVTACY